jgi:hypothetical protein
LVGESLEAFLARLSDLYVAASMREQGIPEVEVEGLDVPTASAPTRETSTEEAKAAGDLVEVVRHQMDGVRDRLLNTRYKE